MSTFNQFEIPLKLKYDVPDSKEGRINLYSGPKSIFGFGKVIQLSTHLILNDEVINRSTAVRNAEFYLLPSKKGSYIQELNIIVLNYPAESLVVSTIAINVLSNHISDAIKWLISSAAGITDSAYVPLEPRLGSKLEPHFDDLQVVMDGAILEAHKTVERSGGSVVLSDANHQELVTFNQDTLDYIKETKVSKDHEVIKGHVTRYNVLTGNGRLLDDETGDVIPFSPKRSFNNHLFLSWSLNEVDNERDGKLYFKINRVLNAREHTKRLILSDCKKHLIR